MMCSFMTTGVAAFGDSAIAVMVLSIMMALTTIVDTIMEPGKNAEEKRGQWAAAGAVELSLVKALADGDEESADRQVVEAAALIKTVDLAAEVGYSNSDSSPARPAELSDGGV